MIEQQVKEIGFKLTKSYDHDEYHTNRYEKEVIEVEFTYKGEELVDTTVALKEYIVSNKITFEQIKTISDILDQSKD